MIYIIKFNTYGKRNETYVKEELTQEQIQGLLEQGYEEVSEEDYQLLIGNIDGKEYIRTYDDIGNKVFVKCGEPNPTLKELKDIKLMEVDRWTASKITGGFVSECSGERVRYDSDKDTQLTMQGIALNVDTALFAEKYPKGCPVRGYAESANTKSIFMLTPEQVMQWQADLSIHIGDCKVAGWQKQAEVNACTTKEQLDAIILE